MTPEEIAVEFAEIFDELPTERVAKIVQFAFAGSAVAAGVVDDIDEVDLHSQAGKSFASARACSGPTLTPEMAT